MATLTIEQLKAEQKETLRLLKKIVSRNAYTLIVIKIQEANNNGLVLRKYDIKEMAVKLIEGI